MLRPSLVLSALPLALLLAGCGSTSSGGPVPAMIACSTTVAPGTSDQATVQGALLAAKPGDTVCLTGSRFKLTDELSLAVPKVTLHGEPGVVLDFSGQIGGANALAITANDDVIDSIRIEDPKGVGVRATEVDGITMRNVQVVWTKGPATSNGGYGLYPVQSSRVMIDSCLVSGASDAGIYVGQSRHIIVRNNEATLNVAGIEIENSTDANVYGNHAHDNVGGILVFALPGLRMGESARSRVHDNLVENNDTQTFAAMGNIVHIVPSGTGFLLNASHDDEFDHNTVRGNVSVGIALVSWKVAMMPANDPTYNQYPYGNYVHDNTFTGDGTAPRDIALQVAGLINAKTVPEMTWDGEVDPKVKADPSRVNCFQNNGAADFIDFDYAHLGVHASRDLKPYTCAHATLPAIDPAGFPGQ